MHGADEAIAGHTEGRVDGASALHARRRAGALGTSLLVRGIGEVIHAADASNTLPCGPAKNSAQRTK